MVDTEQGQDERIIDATDSRSDTAWLNHLADHEEPLDFERMKTKIHTLVRAHPGVSLLIAGAAGLIIGSVVRRR